MPEYKSIVNIQWAIKVAAPSYELAEEQIREIVNGLLPDIRYQEISDESIDVDIKKL